MMALIPLRMTEEKLWSLRRLQRLDPDPRMRGNRRTVCAPLARNRIGWNDMEERVIMTSESSCLESNLKQLGLSIDENDIKVRREK